MRCFPSTQDEALAKRALEMALTDEPGATNSAGMISMVSGLHPDLAFDFAVAHRAQVDGMVDTTSRSRYYPGLGYGSLDPAMVSKIKAYAAAHVAAGSRRAFRHCHRQRGSTASRCVTSGYPQWMPGCTSTAAEARAASIPGRALARHQAQVWRVLARHLFDCQASESRPPSGFNRGGPRPALRAFLATPADVLGRMRSTSATASGFS